MAVEGWTPTSIDVVAEFKRGLTWKKSQEHQSPGPDLVPVLRIPNIQSRLELEDLLYLSHVPEATRSKYKATEGSALLVGSNGNAQRVGNCAFIDQPMEFVFASFLIGAAPRDPANLAPEYLYRLLASEPVQTAISESVQGSTGLKNISLTMLRSLPIVLPPLSEQRKIAAIISSVDEVIEKTEALIEQLQVVQKAMMQELLTRGIPGRHTRFKQSEIGEIPVEWDAMLLTDVCVRITDGTHQSVKPVSDGEVPFLYVSCIRDGRILWENAKQISRAEYCRIRKGREPCSGLVLYTAVGSYGHAAIAPADREYAFQRHIAYVQVDPGHAVPEFVASWLNAPVARSWADEVAVGNAQKTVTLQALKTAPIALPSLAEQHEIAGSLAIVDKRIVAEQRVLCSCAATKSALMSVLLTGELRVTPDESSA